MASALNDHPRPGCPQLFDDRDTYRIIEMVCSDPPDGFDRWSLSLRNWLNQAETGLGMFSRQCLGEARIPDLEALQKKTNAWLRYINKKGPTVEWNFTADDARSKFRYG